MRKGTVIGVVVALALIITGLTFGPGDQTTSVKVTAYFNQGGDDLRGAITKTIEDHSGSVSIAMYSFTDFDLKDFLSSQTESRSVKILLSSGHLTDREKIVCHRLQLQDNIEVRYREKFQHKFAVIGSEVVITGSANWAESSLEVDKNANNLVVIENEEIAGAYREEFDRLWKSEKAKRSCYD